MVEMKLFEQTSPKINILNVTSIMIFLSGSPAFLMFCNTRVYYAIVKLKQKIIFLAACQESESKLTIYFTVNLALVNYFDNLTRSLEFPILLNRTT